MLESVRTSLRVAAVIAVLAVSSLSLTACSSGAGSPVLLAIAGDYTASESSGAEVTLPESGTVPPGTVIETSGDDALIELSWPDGSYTRLGADTEFSVGGDGSRGTLIAGAVWNRVSEQASGTYQIDTESGAVSAKGTTFVVACSSECSAAVVEGTITSEDGSELTGPAFATFDEGFGESSPLPWDGVFGDPWAVTNAQLDEAAGFPSAAELYASAPPTLGSLSGDYAGTRTIVTTVCNGYCEQYPPIGDVGERHYVFAIDCSGGVPCTGQIVTDVASDNGEVHSETTDLNYDGEAFSWELNQSIGYGSSDGVSYGKADNDISWRFTATEAKVVDGVYLITAMEGTGQSSMHIVELAEPAGCAQFERDYEADSTFLVTRD